MHYTATFFNSYPGMYAAQSFCHALLAALIAESAVRSWKILDPLARQKFHFLVIVTPIVSFPLYQLINSDRSSPQFRLEALFDVNRWLTIELWGTSAGGILFLLLLGATSLVFLFQELVPVLRHAFGEVGAGDQAGGTAPDPFLETASQALSLPVPRVLLLDEDEPVLFSTTGGDPVIHISSGLARAFAPAQMQAALAHELAHIARNRLPLLTAVFILRMTMFFNPVVLIMFRRAVRDEEKICDDIAVGLTRDPGALAAALGKFYRKPPADAQKCEFPAGSLEEQSHNQHLESRIRRLLQGPAGAEKSTIPLVAAFLVIIILNYFIV